MRGTLVSIFKLLIRVVVHIGNSIAMDCGLKENSYRTETGSKIIVYHGGNISLDLTDEQTVENLRKGMRKHGR